MLIELEEKTQQLLKHVLLDLRRAPCPPSSPKMVKLSIPETHYQPLTAKTEEVLENIKKPARSSHKKKQQELSVETELLLNSVHKPSKKPHKKKNATLTVETEKVLATIKKPFRSSRKKKQQSLSVETELLLNSVHKPSKKARAKKETTLTAETEKVLAKVKKPSRSSRKKKKQALSMETELMLNSVHEPSKKARAKKETTLTAETEKVLAKVKNPSDHKDSLYKKIRYNIKVGVLYEDIAKLMSNNDVSWSDIKKYANNAAVTLPSSTTPPVLTTTTPVLTTAAAVAEAAAAATVVAKEKKDKIRQDAFDEAKTDDEKKDFEKKYDLAVVNYNSAKQIQKAAKKAADAAAAAAAAVAKINAIYAKTPFTKIVLQLCMYTDKNVLDALTYDVENVLPLEILFVLLNSKTTINSSLYGACIKKVIPGLTGSRLYGNNLLNHLKKILNMSQMSNFPEIIMLLTKRIPYLEENAHKTFFLSDLPIAHFKACIWWSVPVYDLSGYLVAIREFRFEEAKLEELATSTSKGPAFKLVLAFENGWKARVNQRFAVVAGAAVLGMMLVANLNPIGASVSAVATVLYLLGQSYEIKTLKEYERYKMICECLYRSGDERGVAPAIMEGYSCLNPKEIKKEVIEMNLRIEEMQLEVEKLERWWQTAIRRPIDFEEEEGNGIELTSVTAIGEDASAATATGTDEKPMTASERTAATLAAPFNWMFGGNEEADEAKKKEAKIAQIIERLEETMQNLGILYFNLRYLDIRLRICSTYYNLEDCTLDMKLVKDLMSKAVNYNNILKRFNTMTTEKMKRSGKRKTRDTKIKRKENNTVAAAINRQTTAINNEKLQIETSINAQTASLAAWQAKTASAFTYAENTFINNKMIAAEVRAAAKLAQTTANKAQRTATTAATSATNTAKKLGLLKSATDTKLALKCNKPCK